MVDCCPVGIYYLLTFLPMTYLVYLVSLSTSTQVEVLSEQVGSGDEGMMESDLIDQIRWPTLKCVGCVVCDVPSAPLSHWSQQIERGKIKIQRMRLRSSTKNTTLEARTEKILTFSSVYKIYSSSRSNSPS